MIWLILFFFFKKNSQSKFPITRNRPITRPLSRLNYPWRGKEACGYKNIGSVRGNTGSLYASEWLICRAIFSQLESMSNRAITIHHLRAKYSRYLYTVVTPYLRLSLVIGIVVSSSWKQTYWFYYRYWSNDYACKEAVVSCLETICKALVTCLKALESK